MDYSPYYTSKLHIYDMVIVMDDKIIELSNIKHVLFIIAALISASAIAQMPVPLLDNDAVASLAQWKIAAPIIQAGLECHQRINPDTPVLSPLLPRNKTGQWEIVPPNSFSVFGLPVQSITIYIDPDGKMGERYTASVAVPMAIAVNTRKFNDQRTKIGSLIAKHGIRPSLTDITCIVSGARKYE
jgi:hypothetical protein